MGVQGGDMVQSEGMEGGAPVANQLLEDIQQRRQGILHSHIVCGRSA